MCPRRNRCNPVSGPGRSAGSMRFSCTPRSCTFTSWVMRLWRRLRRDAQWSSRANVGLWPAFELERSGSPSTVAGSCQQVHCGANESSIEQLVRGHRSKNGRLNPPPPPPAARSPPPPSQISGDFFCDSECSGTSVPAPIPTRRNRPQPEHDSSSPSDTRQSTGSRMVSHIPGPIRR